MCGLKNDSQQLNLTSKARISTRDKRSKLQKQSERDEAYLQKLVEVDESNLMLYLDDIEGKQKGVRVSLGGPI